MQRSLYRFLGLSARLEDSCPERFDPTCLGRSLASLRQPLPVDWQQQLEAFDRERRAAALAADKGVAVVIVGTVTQDGVRVQGATVSAALAGFSIASFASAETDENGDYELELDMPPESSVYLFAETPTSMRAAWTQAGSVPMAREGNLSLVGDPVAADAPQARDFALSTGASLSGRITRMEGAEPVANHFLLLRGDVAGEAIGTEAFAVTDGQGRFRIDGLVPGRYRLQPTANQRCVPEVTDRCSRDFLSLVLEAGEALEDVNLDLGYPSTIRGTVRALEGGTPISGASVTAYDTRGRFAGASGFTGEDGSFEISNLAPGAYRLLGAPAFVGRDFVPEFWPDLPTHLAPTVDEILEADVVLAPVNGVLDGIDFELGPSGSISGRFPVVDTSPEPPPIWRIDAVDSDGHSVFSFSSFFTIGDTYELNFLPAGDYKIVVADDTTQFSVVEGIGALPPLRFLREVYPGIPCTACDTTSLGTPVPVLPGETTGSIDLDTSTGATLSGQVRVAGTDGPASAAVLLMDADTGIVAPEYRFLTDANGDFQAPVGPGTYVVLAAGRSQSMDHAQLFDGTPCPVPGSDIFCPTDGATEVTTFGAPVTGIDFVFDACVPDQLSLDQDGDGRRDQCDECVGNDSFGDIDGDGICGDLDCGDANPDEGWCRRFDGGRVLHLPLDSGAEPRRSDAVDAVLVDATGFHGAASEGEVAVIPGVLGQAIAFDGAGSVDLPTAPLQAFQQCTVTTWLRLDDDEPGSVGQECCNSIFSEDRFDFGALHINQYLADQINQIEFALAGRSSVSVVRTDAVSLGTWAHYAYRYDSNTGKIDVFIDGSLEFTSEFDAGTPCGSGRPATLGAWLGFEGELVRFLDGAIDDFRIYARTLDDDEIATLASRREVMFLGGFE